MMLSDVDIRWRMSDHMSPEDRLIVRPYPDDEAFQPASIDLRLGDFEGSPIMKPGDFALASTYEWVDIPTDLAARIEGKSSWGRRGLAVHITAGFVDPGFKGRLVLELKNLGNEEIILATYLPIAQLSFFQLSSRAARPYGSDGLNSHYQGQRGIEHSWMEDDGKDAD